MPRFQRTAIDAPPSSNDDPRLGSFINIEDAFKVSEETELAIIGFGHDTHGDDRFQSAPDQIRRFLYDLTPDLRDFKPFVKTLRQTVDFGNLVVDGQMDEALQALSDAVKQLRTRDVTVIILGGHDHTTLGHFLGYANAEDRIAIVNIDSHSGVSQEANDSQPFRKIIEHECGKCRRYFVAGPQRFSTPRADFDYINETTGDVHWADELNHVRINELFSNLDSSLMCRFDVDAVNLAFARGVVKPNPMGLTPETWCRTAFEAGRSSRTTSVEFVGLAPENDTEQDTARLVAIGVWNFLHGFASRW